MLSFLIVISSLTRTHLSAKMVHLIATPVVVSLPPGGAYPPRASIFKKMPRKLRNIFLSQKGSPLVSNTGNKHLSLKSGGGLVDHDRLPSPIHLLLCKMINETDYRNPTVPLASQFLVYLQNGLLSLDEILLKYKSPVYNSCPFKVRTYQNGRKEVLKNTAHPAYEKRDSLLKRVFFDDNYHTTRICFPWKGFYLPKVTSHRHKYAFFSFVCTMDLFFGAFPLWPLPMASQFQLDRKDPMRHYTLDNVRWLSKSDDVANKPSHGKEKGGQFKTTKDMVRLLHSCERANVLSMEILGALTEGYETDS
jgi:hypothetical protein